MKCWGCGNHVDYNAAFCPSCGRPDAGKEELNPEQTRGLIYALLLTPIVLFGAYKLLIFLGDAAAKSNAKSSITSSQPLSENRSESQNAPDISNSTVPTNDSNEQDTRIELTNPSIVVEQAATEYAEPQSMPQSHIDTTETSDVTVNTDAVFTSEASIQDSDGYAILRSRPSKFSDNLGSIKNGTIVYTFPQTKKWHQIRLSSGEVGYVKEKQLAEAK